jgi:hypothetical protein
MKKYQIKGWASCCNGSSGPDAAGAIKDAAAAAIKDKLAWEVCKYFIFS